MKVAICGSRGKMGKVFVQYFKCIYELVPVDCQDVCLNDVIKEVDVVVDFTNADGAFVNGVIALTHDVPIVIGTTGLKTEQKATLKKISDKRGVGCLLASNFSTGMLWIKRNVDELSKYFDRIRIVEEHHQSKLDSPSGTALSLQKLLNIPNDNITSIRGPKKSVRHKILLDNSNESLVIEHIVKDRSAYMTELHECLKNIKKMNTYIELE